MWQVVELGENKVALKGQNGKYLVAEANGQAHANGDEIGPSAQFLPIIQTNQAYFPQPPVNEVGYSSSGYYGFKSPVHNKHLVAEGDLNANRGHMHEWETFEVMCKGE